MAKIRLNKYGIEETKNRFKIRGVVFGTKSQNFYKDESNKRSISFGVNINKNKPIYCRLQGFTKDAVYYSNNDRTKPETIQVKWANRMKAPKEGFEVIGVKVGLEQDTEGKNIVKSFAEYDAVQYMSKQLKDGDSVLVTGKIDPYIANDGTVKKNYVIEQIYRTSAIDFDADDFTEKATFTQTLMFTDIEKETDADGKNTGRFIVTGNNVAYQNICPVSFIIDENHPKWANNVKKNIKPFNSVDIAGYINISTNITEVENEDAEGWGSFDKFADTNKRKDGPNVVEFIIGGIDPSSINEDRYDEKSVMDAIKKMKSEREARKNFGEKSKGSIDIDPSDDWGDSSFGEDDDNPW